MSIISKDDAKYPGEPCSFTETDFADFERRELRERCLHAALHPNLPGGRPLKQVLADAAQIEAYLNGSAE